MLLSSCFIGGLYINKFVLNILGKDKGEGGILEVYDKNKNHTQEPHKDHNTYCISYRDGSYIPLSLVDIELYVTSWSYVVAA